MRKIINLFALLCYRIYVNITTDSIRLNRLGSPFYNSYNVVAYSILTVLFAMSSTTVAYQIASQYQVFQVNANVTCVYFSLIGK